MRWLIAGLVAATAPARAKPVAPPPGPTEPDTFWRRIVEPHADEVRQLRDNARRTMQAADANLASQDVEQRRRFYTDAYHLLREARRLDPENVDVLGLLGRAADELGRTQEALEALHTSIRLTGPDAASSETLGRLGAIYARLGDRDAAIRWLRRAQTPTNPNAAATVDLGISLAGRGEIVDAIDTLQNALPVRLHGSYLTPELGLIAFALAVVYDRDEQQAAAVEILAQMQTTLTSQYATQLGNALSRHRFATAEDEHYFRGLLYESLGHPVEARAQWAIYASIPGASYRARALDHITALDRHRRTRPVTKPAVRAPVPRRQP